MEIQNSVLERVDNADIIGGVFNIPDAITAIGDCAFYGYAGLTSVVIPDSVTSIENYAFYDCTGLTSVDIPDSVNSIGRWAFRGCSGLTSIIIPKPVKSIGDYAFYGCSGLTSITIPDSVTSIEYCAFRGCSGLLPYADKSAIIDIALEILPEYAGLCACLDEATRIMSMRVGRAINVQSTFPNFRREIAIEKFGGLEDSLWWPVEDKASRIKFLEYLRNN